jgi:hypothetical protein
MSALTTIIIVAVVLILLAGVGVIAYIAVEEPQLLGMPGKCRPTGDFGEFEQCNEEGKTIRVRPYDGENYEHCNYTETKDCSEVEKDCDYAPWEFGDVDSDGKYTKTRGLNSGAANLCTQLSVNESCEYSEYGAISEHDPVSGAKTQSRSLISGPMEKCLDLIKTKTYNTIEIDVTKIDGNNKISVGVFGEGDKLTWVRNPMEMVVGKNRIFTDITSNKVRIWYTDGGDIYLKDIKYNGVSIMATGVDARGNDIFTKGAKEGNIFWRADYDYTIA